jgi:hypothetical protein
MYVSEYVSEKWDLGEGTTRRMDKKRQWLSVLTAEGNVVGGYD